MDIEQYIRYANAKAAKEMAAKQEVDRQEPTKLDFGKTRRMIDQAFVKRNTTETVFKTLVTKQFICWIHTTLAKTRFRLFVKFSKR